MDHDHDSLPETHNRAQSRPGSAMAVAAVEQPHAKFMLEAAFTDPATHLTMKCLLQNSEAQSFEVFFFSSSSRTDIRKDERMLYIS